MSEPASFAATVTRDASWLVVAWPPLPPMRCAKPPATAECADTNAGRRCRQRLKGLHEIMEITEVHRLDRPDSHPHPLWHIEGHNFELRLRAPGYTQHLRLPPQHVPRQTLTSAERAGISFAEQSFG
jgi:hypothetical protein